MELSQVGGLFPLHSHTRKQTSASERGKPRLGIVGYHEGHVFAAPLPSKPTAGMTLPSANDPWRGPGPLDGSPFSPLLMPVSFSAGNGVGDTAPGAAIGAPGGGGRTIGEGVGPVGRLGMDVTSYGWLATVVLWRLPLVALVLSEP